MKDEENLLIDISEKVIGWWEQHKYDEQGGFREPVYEEEPDFVSIAKQVLKNRVS